MYKLLKTFGVGFISSADQGGGSTDKSDKVIALRISTVTSLKRAVARYKLSGCLFARST